MLNVQLKVESRVRRHQRVRKTVFGLPHRPRLVVFRSNQHIYAQIVDDTAGKTVVAASTLDPECKKSAPRGNNRKAAEAVGQLIAKRAMAKNIKTVVFDRGGYLFHGRVKALADAARQGGLIF
ncbi:MAG TPA: 50S ribosomal protein L18 [Nitrospiria bacterium]|nr:50S ribosomal protein L18 [Nitrospiria bacterium]